MDGVRLERYAPNSIARHFPYEAVQLIPNHQNQDVTARYQGESDKLATMMREALDYWGNYCDELEGRKAKLRAVKGGKA